MRDIHRLLHEWVKTSAPTRFTNGLARRAVEQLSPSGQPLSHDERQYLSAALELAVQVGWLRRVKIEADQKRSGTYEVVYRPGASRPVDGVVQHHLALAPYVPLQEHISRKEAVKRLLWELRGLITPVGSELLYFPVETVVAGTNLRHASKITREDVHFPLLNCKAWGLLDYDGRVIRTKRATRYLLVSCCTNQAELGELVDQITREADRDRKTKQRTRAS